MQTSRRRVVALATTAVLSLSSLTAAPAPAEAYTNPSQSSSSQSSSDKRRTYFYEISQLPFIATGILRLLTGVLGLPGFHLINIGQFFQEIPENFPYPVDTSITEVKLLSREVANYPRSQERRLERWTVASPSMGRNIAVDVRLPKPDGQPAPTLVMLDGVEAPLHSGWLNERSGNDFDRVLGEENVTVVFPLDANGTWYSDWINDDPQLGRQKWETFITKELLPLLESQPDINANGKRAIGGLSMGATGAVQTANQNPDLFNAAFGISGCYSTMSPLGRQTMQVVPQSRGADPKNMWGRHGSAEWLRHDVERNPEGLRNQAVYLSTATGSLLLDQYYADTPIESLSVGWALETGTYQCTRDLEKSMKRAGMNHQQVNYRDRGTHNWETFRVELEPAWNHIKPALY